MKTRERDSYNTYKEHMIYIYGILNKIHTVGAHVSVYSISHSR